MIVSQPANVTVYLGDPVSFTVRAATKHPPLKFQWQQSKTTGGGGQWAAIAGATDSIYSIAAVVDSQRNYSFRCVVSDSSSVNSSTVRIILLASQIAMPQTAASAVRFCASFAGAGTSKPVVFTFSVQGNAKMNLSIYTSLGRTIFSDSWVEKSGDKKNILERYIWNAKRPASTGLYIAVLRVNGEVMSKIETAKFEIIR